MFFKRDFAFKNKISSEIVGKLTPVERIFIRENNFNYMKKFEN
jgi:hypothetical protein